MIDKYLNKFGSNDLDTKKTLALKEINEIYGTNYNNIYFNSDTVECWKSNKVTHSALGAQEHKVDIFEIKDLIEEFPLIMFISWYSKMIGCEPSDDNIVIKHLVMDLQEENIMVSSIILNNTYISINVDINKRQDIHILSLSRFLKYKYKIGIYA